ncbi:MAG: YqeG family HAD IIIA-type phosphatase [Clostridia bacterium]|nr:YqeG family HAD IIIA-type phosphatase [Clostridia bacterium]
MKKLLPILRYRGVEHIEFEKLDRHNVKGILLDVDNTLIDYHKNLSDKIVKWVQEAKNKGFKICILSNSNKEEKIKKVADALEIKYIMFARKPLQAGFKKAINLLELKPENIAMIGDQVFTDVLGANIANMVSVYVDPIDRKEYWYTSWKRPIEDFILRKVR